MNFRPNRPGNLDALDRLFRLWNLTSANAALARAYLEGDQADGSLLSGVERQVFAPFDWQEQQAICAALQEVTRRDGAKVQAKVLKLLWAIGRSTAGFAALFNQYDFHVVSESTFHLYCQVLGPAAAAAIDAEYPSAWPSGYEQTRRLHQLARTAPDTLLEAQRLIADPQNSMAVGILAGSCWLPAQSGARRTPG